MASLAVSQNYISDKILRDFIRKNCGSGEIATIFDIGANHGGWASEIRAMAPKARLILFEANPIHRETLEASGFENFIGILSKPGVYECEFFTPESSTAKSTGASYYKEVTPAFNEVKSTKLKATPLDELVEQNNLPQPDLIKIDTQGSELDIIEGGQTVFKNTKWVVMELPVVEYNSGAPNIQEYLSKMNELGFLPIGLSEIHKFGSIVIQLDFLFANKALIREEDKKGLRILD